MNDEQYENILKGINKITGCSKDEAKAVYDFVTKEYAIS